MHSWRHLVKTIIFLAFIWKSATGSEVSIVGGQEIKAHSKPWMVSLQVNKNHVCGGTLVKDQWDLTAAHCRSVFGASDVSVVLGAHSLEKQKGTQRVAIKGKPFVPQTFSETTRVDDIMLIKLQDKVKTNKHVKVKELPKSGKDLRPGAKCQVIGWGIVRVKDKRLSDKLRWAEVAVLDRELCGCLYGNNPVITEDMLCATNEKKRADACWGDSGGPLECGKVLVGLVSGGNGCGAPEKPGVYTRLSKRHLMWIHNTIKQQNNSTSSA